MQTHKTKPDDNLCVVCQKDLGNGIMVLFPDTCFSCVIADHTKGYVPDTTNWALEARKQKKQLKRRKINQGSD